MVIPQYLVLCTIFHMGFTNTCSSGPELPLQHPGDLSPVVTVTVAVVAVAVAAVVVALLVVADLLPHDGARETTLHARMIAVTVTVIMTATAAGIATVLAALTLGKCQLVSCSMVG